MSMPSANPSGRPTLQIPMNTLSPGPSRLSNPSIPFPTPVNGATPAYVGEPEDPAAIESNAQLPVVKPDTTDTWKHVLATMKKYDEKMLAGWKDELSNLLIFAGLFSAVVTAFNIESYQWLKADPQDQTVQLLQKILQQGSSPSISLVGPGLQDTTPDLAPFEASTIDVIINVLWFLSLTFALTAALLAILIQQWIRQYEDMPLVDGSERARIRQKRFIALHKWKVPRFVMALSVLLQAALSAFFAGLLILLWGLNNTVSIAVSSAVGAFLLICAVTTVVPTFFSSSPYLSPLSQVFRALTLAALWITLALIRLMLSPLRKILTIMQPDKSHLSTHRRGFWGKVGRELLERLTVLKKLNESVTKRLLCRNWLAVEKYRMENVLYDSSLVRKAMRWTSKTSAAVPMETLAMCVLDTAHEGEHVDPQKAAVEWLGEVTRQPKSHLKRALAAREINSGPIPSGTTGKFSSRNLDCRAVAALVQQACKTALSLPIIEEPGQWPRRKQLRDMALWAVDRRRKEPIDECWVYLAKESDDMEYHHAIIIVLSITQELIARHQADPPEALATDCLTTIVKGGFFWKIHDAMNADEINERPGMPKLKELRQAYELVAMASLELGLASGIEEARPTRSRTTEFLEFLKTVDVGHSHYVRNWCRTFDRMLARSANNDSDRRLARIIIDAYFHNLLNNVGWQWVAKNLDREAPVHGRARRVPLLYPLLTPTVLSMAERWRAHG